MNFVALGETLGKLSKDFKNQHKNIPWRKIYAFRNIIAHEYFGVDEDEIFGIIKKHLPDFYNNLKNID